MEKNYFEAVAELCRVENVNEISDLSQKDIVNNYILPRAVVEGGQDKRGWRIGDSFMQFMADYGQTCVQRDHDTGELLMELAMQRISKGAVIRKVVKGSTGVTASYNLLDALPEKYRRYSSAYDQYGIMSQECWNFLKSNLEFCLNQVWDSTWAEHAKKICFGLLTHITPSGYTLNGYLWNEALVNESLKEVYEFVEEVAVRSFGVQQVAHWLLPNWRHYKAFFKKNASLIDFHDLFEDWGEAEPGLDYDAEGLNYYNGKAIRIFKLFGCYKSKVAKAVKTEMLAA